MVKQKKDRMKTWQEMNMLERITEILVLRYGCDRASSVTQALTYCIFGAQSSRLVHHADTKPELWEAISEDVLEAAVEYVERELIEIRARVWASRD